MLDVPTRWNSTYDMLATAIKLEKSLTEYSIRLYQKKELSGFLDDSDWDTAKTVADLLEPFYDGKSTNYNNVSQS